MLLPTIYFLQEDQPLVVGGPTRRWVGNGPSPFDLPPSLRALLAPLDKLGVSHTPREHAPLAVLGQGEARLYLTPAAVHRSIETKG